MTDLTLFISQHWQSLLGAAIAVIGGGFALRWRSHRQSGSSVYSDQRNAKAGGDIVGRDKTVNRNERR